MSYNFAFIKTKTVVVVFGAETNTSAYWELGYCRCFVELQKVKLCFMDPKEQTRLTICAKLKSRRKVIMSIALGMGATEAVASLAANYGKHVVIVCRPTVVQTMRRLVFKHNPTNWETIHVMSPTTLRKVGDTMRRPDFLVVLDFPHIRPPGENMHWYNWLLLFSKRTLLIARY